jgi:hypothetical protein
MVQLTWNSYVVHLIIFAVKTISHYIQFNNTNQRMKITCSSRYGWTTLYIPTSFKGNVDCSADHGKVEFSDPVSRNLTRFSTFHGKHLGFLSPEPIPSGPESASAFTDAPDSLVASTVHSNLRIRYLEEALAEDEEESRRERERQSKLAKRGILGLLF